MPIEENQLYTHNQIRYSYHCLTVNKQNYRTIHLIVKLSSVVLIESCIFAAQLFVFCLFVFVEMIQVVEILRSSMIKLISKSSPRSALWTTLAMWQEGEGGG